MKYQRTTLPELVLAQPRMDAESALHTSIYVMTKVYEELGKLKEEAKEKA